MNPEFRRHVWLELTGQRLVVMPVVIGAFVWLTVLVNGGVDRDVADALVWVYGALGLLWGTRLTSECVVSEIVARTWDGQRMSSLRPWSMCWAKLFGSAVFVWYGCALLGAAYLVADVQARGDPWSSLARLALVTACLVIAHATSLLTSLHAVRRTTGDPPTRGAGLFAFGLLAAAPFLLWGNAALDAREPLQWYGAAHDAGAFLVASCAAFALWAVIGSTMLMRLELQRRNGPWVWLGFVAFTAAWVAGFADGGAGPLRHLTAQRWEAAGSRLLLALAVTAALYYVTLLAEPKDPVEFRRLGREAGAGRWRAAAEVVPRWLVTLGAVLAVAAALLVTVASAGAPIGGLVGFVAASVGFMVRDAALLVALNLSPRPRRADAAGFLYLVVLYGLAPSILAALDLDHLKFVLWPLWDAGIGVAAPALVQAVLAGVFAASRWRRYRARTAVRIHQG